MKSGAVQRRRPKRTWVIGLVGASLLATACGGVDDAATSVPNSPPSVTTVTEAPVSATKPHSPAPTTTAAATGELLELHDGLPRSIDYVWVETTITAASIGAIEPRTFVRDEQIPSETTFVFLTLDVVNRSQTEGVILSPLPYSILVDGEPQLPPEVIEGRANVGMGPLGSDEKVLAFAIPNGTSFDQLSLSVGEPGRIPAELPLIGDVVQHPYPVALVVFGEGPARGGVSGCNQALDITMLGGTIAIDLVDSAKPPTAYGSRRANVGERFLSLDVRVFNNGGSRCGGGGTNYAPSAFRVLVDGVARAPVTFFSGIIAADTAADLTIDFVYPVDAETIEFQVGAEEGTMFSTLVDVAGMPAVMIETP